MLPDPPGRTIWIQWIAAKGPRTGGLSCCTASPSRAVPTRHISGAPAPCHPGGLSCCCSAPLVCVPAQAHPLSAHGLPGAFLLLPGPCILVLCPARPAIGRAAPTRHISGPPASLWAFLILPCLPSGGPPLIHHISWPPVPCHPGGFLLPILAPLCPARPFHRKEDFILGGAAWGVFRAPARPPFVVRQKEAKADLGAAAPKDPWGPGGLNIFWLARLESSCAARRWPAGIGTAGRTGGPPREMFPCKT